MPKSAITVSLVPEAAAGPFVYHCGVSEACDRAARSGFDAIEIFAPSADVVDRGALRADLKRHNLNVAAVGTGAGMLRHGWSLSHPDSSHRNQACEFVETMIRFGAQFDAPAIIGSMQGKAAGEVTVAQARKWLAESLDRLGAFATDLNVPLFYEPLNRYETNLICTVADAVDMLESIGNSNVKLLADLFHMNIEEADVATAIRHGGSWIGHVHFVDSNRRAAGMGHTRFDPIITALQDIGYEGYLSAEAFPIPDADAAAATTIHTFDHYFGESS